MSGKRCDYGLEGRRTSGRRQRVSCRNPRVHCPRIPQAAHRAGHALRLIVDPSAVAAVHLGACLLQRPRGHGVRVGQPTLGAKLAGSLQLSDEQNCSVVVETGRHPVQDHIPHRSELSRCGVSAATARRRRTSGVCLLSTSPWVSGAAVTPPTVLQPGPTRNLSQLPNALAGGLGCGAARETSVRAAG